MVPSILVFCVFRAEEFPGEVLQM